MITQNKLEETNYELKKEGNKGLSSEHAIKEKVDAIIKSKPESTFKLRAVSRATVVTVLDECMEQLSVIKFLLHETVRDTYNKLFHYRSPIERLIPSEESTQHILEEQYEKIPYTDFNKLQEDICFICNILEEGSKEILGTGFYTSILRLILGVEQEETDLRQIERLYIRRQNEIKDFNITIDMEKGDFKKDLEEAETSIWQLQQEVEHVLRYGNQEKHYANNWETARKFQNDLVLTMNEDAITDSIAGYQLKIETENRSHNELLNYIEENVEDIQNTIQYWMQKYDDDVEAMDTELIKMKMIWEQLSADHIALHDLYDFHKKEMEDWIIYKEEKRVREELERLRNHAAIKIQAWWRGIMVRRRLGRFKKLKLPKQKKKNKK